MLSWQHLTMRLLALGFAMIRTVNGANLRHSVSLAVAALLVLLAAGCTSRPEETCTPGEGAAQGAGAAISEGLHEAIVGDPFGLAFGVLVAPVVAIAGAIYCATTDDETPVQQAEEVLSPGEIEKRREEIAAERERQEAQQREEINRCFRECDPESMYQYAYRLNNLQQSWRLYCLAAHKGHAKAQYALGNYYRYGHDPILQNLVRAYLWYSISGMGVDWSEEPEITQEQMAQAKHLLDDWKPDSSECESTPSATLSG